jgi:defect-in-organelle-trafficking protein DotC
MADHRPILLAAVSFAALFITPVMLMRAAEAADISATPQAAEPDFPTKKLAVPMTTAAPPAAINNLIVMPVPPQPSPATVDAAAHETGNPTNKPVTGA